MKKTVLFLLSALVFSNVFGQEMLNLEKCLEISYANNLDLKQLQVAKRSSAVNLRQAQLNYLPTVNLTNSLQRSTGATFDMNAFRRVTTSTNSGRHTVSASLDLFNGMSNLYTLKKAQSDLSASEYSILKSRNDITSLVVLSYFQVIYDRENLIISKSKKDLIEKQLERVRKQADAGVKTIADVLNLESQLATENMNLINQENLYKRDRLSLLQAMNVDPSGNYEFQAPAMREEIGKNPVPDLQEVISYALGNLPDMKEKEMRLISSQYAMKASRSLLYPNLFLSAAYSTSYSSNGIFDYTVPGGLRKAPYPEQLKENGNEYISLNLNIPVFNNYSASASLQKAKLQVENAQIDYQRERNNQIKEIQQAHLDVQSAAAKYEAAKSQLESLSESLQFAQTRYENGLLDFYTYMEVLNNKTGAEVQMTNAGYDYLLKLKILDLYQGKPLKF